MSKLYPSVMVVDDERELVILYSRFIELSGFNCIYFTSPREALDYFSSNPEGCSLIIIDLKMPDINGLELAKRMRLYNKTVKIILVTSFLVEENLDYDEAKEAGIDIVLEKPFHLKDLRPLIKEILGA